MKIIRGLGPLLIALAALLAATTAPAAETGPKAALLGGLYQSQDASASCRLSAMDDGSLLMMLWQGGARQAGQLAGYTLVGRLVPGRAGRLAGAFQALPDTCCPIRGRIELEAEGNDTFRVVYFAPSLNQAAWQILPRMQFSRVSEPAPAGPLQRLAGQWRVSYWYTDLLPGGAPADDVDGDVEFAVDQQALSGRWLGHGGTMQLTPSAGGARLQYRDDAAGFGLEADLREQAQGLALTGSFRSTLGAGHLRLTRRGLPASPPGHAAEAGGDLSGLWVDPRTGQDFYDISGSTTGLRFTAYGGTKARPRYLSQGQAQPDDEGWLVGTAKDQPGHCCGNQGRLRLRLTDDGRLEVRSVWWPQGRPDPGGEPTTAVYLERTGGRPASAVAHSGWPLVTKARPGLLSPQAGALEVAFTWQPQGDARRQTLFSQGGYDRDMDLFIDRSGRLAAVIGTQAGPLVLDSRAAVEPRAPHTARLVYSAGEGARLFLDGREVAEETMPGGWRGSRSPYIVGGSRWPGREFQGEIKAVSLWSAAANPEEHAIPALVIQPTGGGAAATAQRPGPAGRVKLHRYWHPRRQRHAYAATTAQKARLAELGFQDHGPIAALWQQDGTGRVALRLGADWAVEAGPVDDDEALLGFAAAAPQSGAVELWRLRGDFPAPLGGKGPVRDELCTSLSNETGRLMAAGYGHPEPLAWVMPVEEARPTAPVAYTWGGSWQGEGWGRFFIQRQGNVLLMFWYYSNRGGPHYFGRYTLDADGLSAEGIAVGRPGPKATYYRHRLRFRLDAPQGPVIEMTSSRLAAPLDDGRLVRFRHPETTKAELIKTSLAIPAPDAAVLHDEAEGIDPSLMYEQALGRAMAKDKLIDR